MRLLTKAVSRLQTEAHLIVHPSLFALRQRGGLIDTFQRLSQSWFRELNIATVLDIGANIGQFAVTINSLLPKAQVYSFEPLPDCFEKLQTRMRGVRNFMAFNLALGEDIGDLMFERNNFSPSSSFLSISEVHKEAFPHTRDYSQVKVKIERLDHIVENLVITYPLMVKIDVQGYEDRVLRGGAQTIRRSKIIILETSFMTLYKGQPLFDDIYQTLVNWGYTYAGALDQLYSPHDGRVLQEDSVFVKV
jgi:FkbM family methyltransferase